MPDAAVEVTLQFEETPVTCEDFRREFERRADALAEPDESEGTTVEWTGQHCRRRLRFEPRGSGGWRRIEERQDAGEWLFVGSEIVSDLDVEATGDVATSCAATGVRGP